MTRTAPPRPARRPTEVAPGVHQVTHRGINVFLLNDGDDFALIDSGLPDHADAILDAIRSLGREPARLTNIVLTHAHPDHIGGAAALVRATGAQTWMHPLDAPVAEGREEPRALRPAREWRMRLTYAVLTRRPPPVIEPVTISHHVSDQQVLPIAGGLEIIHTPGHTAGHIALRRADGVLFIGDACSHQSSLTSPLGWEDPDQGRTSLTRLATTDVDVACFAHGRPITKHARQRLERAFGGLSG